MLIKYDSMPLVDPDLIGSMIGIFKLEDAYLIEPIQFAFGNVSETYPSIPLKGILIYLSEN